MSTGCQKAKNTDRQTGRLTDRQADKPELGKYRIAIRYLRILDISTIRRHE